MIIGYIFFSLLFTCVAFILVLIMVETVLDIELSDRVLLRSAIIAVALGVAMTFAV